MFQKCIDLTNSVPGSSILKYDIKRIWSLQIRRRLKVAGEEKNKRSEENNFNTKRSWLTAPSLTIYSSVTDYTVWQNSVRNVPMNKKKDNCQEVQCVWRHVFEEKQSNLVLFCSLFCYLSTHLNVFFVTPCDDPFDCLITWTFANAVEKF